MVRYRGFSNESMILRDLLALDRTLLANERTFLAYLRTAIMVLISGLTLIKLFSDYTVLTLIGMALIPISMIFFAIGYIRFFRFRRSLRHLQIDKIDREVIEHK
ncbi:MAG TPA: DUF202 domain-containing protein [bacterium]|jgi:putative membrane protein|nr:DUF202 domain-containing protein [bacterium]HNT64990.1 DUF202 domain-containing protein [bacterium]HOX84398.1 DUF202 domain-containing protein [bacterium]HPG46005.1 DUF202 domain-containing protein [bacterium]HPM97827.1 DUF202 domain-containing protein [bacterium]